MKKKCLECESPLVGRVDKKFCSDYCRNAFNNNINSDKKNLIRTINNRLRRNNKILTDLNTTGKTKVLKSRLLDANFDFNYITATYTTKTGSTYFYVYDQGYLPLENDYFLLVKNE